MFLTILYDNLLKSQFICHVTLSSWQWLLVILPNCHMLHLSSTQDKKLPQSASSLRPNKLTFHFVFLLSIKKESWNWCFYILCMIWPGIKPEFRVLEADTKLKVCSFLGWYWHPHTRHRSGWSQALVLALTSSSALYSHLSHILGSGTQLGGWCEWGWQVVAQPSDETQDTGSSKQVAHHINVQDLVLCLFLLCSW